MIKKFSTLPIRSVLGLIETKQLDADQEDLWSKIQQLPDGELNFGWKLIKYGVVEGKTHFDNELDMPSTMEFRIILSDNDHYILSYSDIFQTA